MGTMLEKHNRYFKAALALQQLPGLKQINYMTTNVTDEKSMQHPNKQYLPIEQRALP